MDSALIPKGVKRCPLPQFGAALMIVSAVLLWGVFAMLLVWFKGLNQTNMNNAYGFAFVTVPPCSSWPSISDSRCGAGSSSGMPMYIPC